jgi:FixJ family two-component response regulator
MQPMPSATVFVIDDDANVRAAIQGLLKSAGLRCVGFATAEKFLEEEHSGGPSCLIVDVSLPGISGLEFQERMKKAGRQIPIVFITGHGDIPMSVKAMKAGALEFLTKPFDDNDLLSAVEQALERDSASRQAQAQMDVLRSRYQELTPREREVMALVVTGLLNKQVAAELGTSEITIKVHRARIMNKMKAGSLAELVRMAESLGVFRSA